jgi:hypothetical protein
MLRLHIERLFHTLASDRVAGARIRAIISASLMKRIGLRIE